MNKLPETKIACEIRVGLLLRKWIEEGRMDYKTATRILKAEVRETTFDTVYELVFNSKDVNYATTER